MWMREVPCIDSESVVQVDQGSMSGGAAASIAGYNRWAHTRNRKVEEA